MPLNALKDCGVGRSEYIMSWRELDLENQTDLNVNPGSSPFKKSFHFLESQLPHLKKKEEEQLCPMRPLEGFEDKYIDGWGSLLAQQ